jgi:hypothetical protein
MQLTKLLQEIVYTNPAGVTGKNIPSLYIMNGYSRIVACKRFPNLQTSLKHVVDYYKRPGMSDDYLENLDLTVHVYGNLKPISDCALISTGSETFITGPAFTFDILKTLLQHHKDNTIYSIPLSDLDDLFISGVGDFIHEQTEMTLGELLKHAAN